MKFWTDIVLLKPRMLMKAFIALYGRIGLRRCLSLKKKIELAVEEAVSLVNQGYYKTEKSRTPMKNISQIRTHLSKRRDERRMQQSARRSLEVQKREEIQ